MKPEAASHLSDGALIVEVARLAACERDATARLIEHLAELYRRRLHEREGCSSLFTYCTDVLRLSEHEAYDRMKAAKVAHRYPAVLELLASAALNLTAVRLLAPHLTRENHEALFAAARGKRKRQVQEMLASRFPQPDVPFSLRRARRAQATATATSAGGGGPVATEAPREPVERASVERASVERASIESPSIESLSVVPPSVESPAIESLVVVPPSVESPTIEPRRPARSTPPPAVRPLAPDRYHLSFTVTGEACELLALAQDLLRHVIPSGDPAEVVTRALRALVDELVKRKFAVSERPRSGQAAAAASRHIPADVKRAVYVRDRGRCTFVGAGGRRCGERGFLEFDHYPLPHARGGRATVDNIALRCRSHNQYEAAALFGGDRCRPARPDSGERAAEVCPG